MGAAPMSAGGAGEVLWEAANAGNTAEVTRLVESGAPVNWAGKGVRIVVAGLAVGM